MERVCDTATVDARRRQVARAVRTWADQLVDLSGRNQLLYHRPRETGTLDLGLASGPSVAALLADMPVRLSQLYPPDAGAGHDAPRRARAIHGRALAYFEERGVETLFLAVGLASWTTDGAATPAAPVLLRPLRLDPRGAAAGDFDVRLHGDWQVNAALLHLLRTEFAVSIDAEGVLALLDVAADADLDTTVLFERLAKEAAEVPGFAVRDATIAGTFAYTKLPMVTDLRDNVDRLASHDLIAALAGVEGARQALRELRARDTDPHLPDRIPPGDEFLVLDADASQHRAVSAALEGQPLIIQGPPGTGKSQTIANLIGALAAQGRRVLFVAEKRAAIDAVTSRLERVGLGGLVMDLHGGVTSKRRIAEALGATIEQIGRVPAAGHAELHHRLETSRSALAGHAAAMHEVRAPWGVSVFTVIERLGGLDPGVTSTLRFAGAQLEALDAETVRTARDALREWVRLGEPLATRRSPWTGAAVTTSDEARDALELLATLAHTSVPEAVAHLDRILADTDLPPPSTVDAWRAPLALLRGFSGTARRLDPAVFDLDLDDLTAALTPATAAWPRRVTARLVNRRFRAARRELTALWREPATPTPSQLYAAAVTAREQLAGWRRLGGQRPPGPLDDLDAVVAAHDRLLADLGALGVHLGRRDLLDRPHPRLAGDVAALMADERTLLRLPRLHELETWLTEHHLRPLLRMVADGAVDGRRAVDVLDHAWLSSVHAAVVARDTRLAGFDGGLLHDHAARFREDDRHHIEVTAARLRRAVAEHATRVRDRYADQDEVVLRQVRRKRGHLPLRALFEQAADVLTALRPCWAMSPLAVSQTLPAAQIFDVVIFDEASQVPPADAVPALLRAPQAVIAGDRRQLPPTTFFDAAVDDDAHDDEDAGVLTAGFESILDVLDPVLRSHLLTWHYRSREEPLIAFANRHLYDDRLVTFPGARTDDCLRHELVVAAPGGRVDTRSSDAEVHRVVELMVDHARGRPAESLGVIALGRYHAGRIEAALRERLAAERDRRLDRYFDAAAGERAFVKNLERVQGDERDAVILTIGYGPGEDGRLRYRFGPLLTDGGERRLNVAITRARRRLTVVSSFTHADMDAGRSAAAGVTLLRRYLRYVESRGRHLDEVTVEHAPAPLATAVVAHLEHAGVPATAGYGASSVRVDVAIAHPADPDRMVLAVESDGAGYDAAATTRDRERLRREVLERLGWRHHRVWAADWHADPVGQTRSIVRAYDDACRDLDAAAEEPAAEEDPAPPAPAPAPVRHGRRPVIHAGAPITQYTQGELVELVRWVTSDTLLRTEDQLVDELVGELGYRRRGPRIVEALTAAIRAAAG